MKSEITYKGSALGYLRFFYSYLRHRIFVNASLNIAIGTLDGFGLAMFIPLLGLIDGQEAASAGGLGGLSFIVDGLKGIGIPLTLVSVLSVVLVFFVLKGVATFAQKYYQVCVNRYFITSLRVEMLERLSELKYERFVTTDAGRIQNTLSGEVGRVNSAYGSYSGMIKGWVMVGVYVTFAFLSNPQFALLVAIGGLLTNLLYRQVYAETKKLSVGISRVGHVFHEQLIQKVAFFKYLKATGVMSVFDRRMKRTIRELERNAKKMGFFGALLGSIREPIIILVVVIVILLQVSIWGGSLGGVVLSLVFFYRALNFLMNVQTNWNQFLSTSGAMQTVTEFRVEMDEWRERRGGQQVMSGSGPIVLDNVSFSYGAAKVLDSVSINVPESITTGIVGESGSGKTTLVNVICGLLDVSEGRISVGGVDYRDLDMATLRRRVGYITQEGVIFTGSVFENVSGWAEKTQESISRFWAALEQASIREFVEGLPDGESARLGHNGIQISGGQRQRLAIARELYKGADLLIMDEATSALDSDTEKSVNVSLKQLRGNCSIVVVAHRLSTIRDADQIVVLQGGSVVGCGTFEELMVNCVVFKRMAALQEY